MRGGGTRATELRAPGLWRRLSCFVYEGVLLFGVVMAAGLIYALFTKQSHALKGTTGLQWWLFFILGLYFVAFWSRQGQTLAMRTWHIKLVCADGSPLRPGRALARYLASWIWLAPALLMLHFAGLHGGAPVAATLIVGALAYAASSRLHRSRQYWHDALCGTALIDSRNGPSPQEPGGALGQNRKS